MFHVEHADHRSGYGVPRSRLNLPLPIAILVRTLKPGFWR